MGKYELQRNVLNNQLNSVESEIRNFFHKNENAIYEKKRNGDNVATINNTTYIKPAKETKEYSQYLSDIIKTKSASSSKITNSIPTENIPFVVSAISKPTFPSKPSTNTFSSDSLLQNTFGNIHTRSLREKRKDKKFHLKKDPDSVGYTKFTMKGVDVHYSFPKTTHSQTTTTRRKKQAINYKSKSQDTLYSDLESDQMFIG